MTIKEIREIGNNFYSNCQWFNTCDYYKDMGNCPKYCKHYIPVGQWKNGICSICGFDIRCLIDGESSFEDWVWDIGLNYCPECGKKMEIYNSNME